MVLGVFFSTILYVQLAGLGMEWQKTYVYLTTCSIM